MDEAKQVNPYIAGAPVSGPEMFYGRDDVFSFIERNLVGRHRDTPIVLYGQRRTGKTSVLYQLHRRLAPSYRCVFIDLHGLSLGSMSDFLFGIASAVSRGLRRDYQVDVALPDRPVFLADARSAFEEVFLDAVLARLGEDHLVLMLDEVVRLDEEVRAGRMEREVFDYLRHLMQHHPRLNFIFSLGSGLEEMEKDYAFMFSVSLYHRISFLETAAASALVTEPVRDHFEVAPDAVAKILQITSGHPYYTQLVCHCLFDSWSRSPKPEMTVADVYAVLAEAIELGSANLTYVWEDSTPEERAVMAGMAAAARGGAGEITIGQVRDAWRRSGVALPDRQVAAALRSLASREVVVGDSAYSFAVDLQRLWLDKHRRLDWVKDELAEPIRHWDREARAARRNRYAAAMAVIVLLAGYVSGSAIAGLWPFPGHAAGPTPMQSLLEALPGDLNDDPGECHSVVPHVSWHTEGLDVAVHCTDPGLKGGQVNGYRFDGPAALEASWASFNQWWGFSASKPETGCPPSKNQFGQLDYGDVQIECGLSANGVATYAQYILASDSFVISQAAPGGLSFSELAKWMSSVQKSGPLPSPAPLTLAAGVKKLKVLLPVDIMDASTECTAASAPEWTHTGLVTADSCDPPDLGSGGVLGYQFDSTTDYDAGWANFNTWLPFGVSKSSDCPPPGSEPQGGPEEWWNSSDGFPVMAGQVIECYTDTSSDLVYVWTYPTEDAFMIAVAPKGWTWTKLDKWWTDNSI